MLQALDLKLAGLMTGQNTKPAGWISGVASRPTVDQGADIVAWDAFSNSIAERGVDGPRAVKMLWHHDPREPAGKWLSIEPKQDGLYVEGQINLQTDVGKKTYQHVLAKEVTGLSVGFRTKRREYNEDNGVRTVLEADLWEISPVTFPMHDDARITDVKSLPLEIADGDDVAAIAKKFAAAHHLSRREADAAIDALKAAMREDPDLTALRAALGPTPREPVQRTDAQTAPDPKAYAPAIAAFGRLAELARR